MNTYDCEHGNSCYTCKDCEIVELQAEVRRLQGFERDYWNTFNRLQNVSADHEYDLKSLALCNTSLRIERDRYREALERITTIGKFHCKCCAAHVQIASNALRGEEE